MAASPRPLPAYFAAAFAGAIGVASLLLLFVFLVVGPFDWIDLGLGTAAVPVWSAVLCLTFSAQHSGMIRRSLRRRLDTVADPRYHGVLYAIVSGLVLLAVVVLWQESEIVVLRLQGPARLLTRFMIVVSIVGFGWSVWALRGFDLLGVESVLKGLHGRPDGKPLFRVRGPYRWVRHPMYTLTLVLLWSYPDLTLDRLLLNLLWTSWIWVGSVLEERDLVEDFGDAYRGYRRRVPMLLPWRRPYTPSNLK
jgi:protein-S-isoprenylcysteine O-methyltransferase Ste14